MPTTRTSSALFWASADKVVTNGFALVISIILARLVDPSEFGIVATALIFTVILSLFVEPGMTSALIQKKNSDDKDYSTIMTFNIIAGIFLYLCLFFSSDYIADIFDMPKLSPVIKVMGMQTIIGGISSVQIAYVQKHMLFKNYFVCSLTSAVVAASVSVVLAYRGYGVWALVVNSILRSFIILLTVSLVFHWNFKFRFYWDRFKDMFPFASKMLLAKLIDQGYVEVTQAIISKMYSPTDLAFYNRGKSFPDLIISNLNAALGNVLFPVFSNLQDDKNQLKESIKNSIRLTSFVCFPFLVGLIACADNFISVILTNKWKESVPFLQVICLYYLWVPFSNVVWQSLKAVGKSGKVLQLEVIKMTLNITTLLVFLYLYRSPMAVALSLVVAFFLSFIIENIYTIKYLDMRVGELIRCYLPSLSISITMGIIVYAIGFFDVNRILLLIVQISIGIISYFAIAYIFKFDQVNTLKKMIVKKKQN